VLLTGTRTNKTCLLEHTEKVNRSGKLPGSPNQLQWRFKRIVKISTLDLVVDLFCVCFRLFSPASRIWSSLSKNATAKSRLRTNQYTKRGRRVASTRRAAKARWVSWKQSRGLRVHPSLAQGSTCCILERTTSPACLQAPLPTLQKVHLLSADPPGTASSVLCITKSRYKEKKRVLTIY